MDADDANTASNVTADVPVLPDVAITQEWTISRTDLPGDTTNPTANANTDANEDEMNGPKSSTQARKRFITSFKNRGVIAQKSFFLLGVEQVMVQHLHQIRDTFLNGIIMTVPRKGHTEYEIWWDTSVLSFPLEKDKVRKFIHKDDVELAKKLKVSCTVFDQKHTEGLPANIFAAAKVAKHHKRRSGWKRRKHGQECTQSSTPNKARERAVANIPIQSRIILWSNNQPIGWRSTT